MASANEAPSPVVATFVTSLNETIDLDAKRWNAMRWHLPSAVWILVLVAASVGCYATGFHAGRTGARPRSPIYPAGTRHMIIGLIRRSRSFALRRIGISQQPLVDLKATLSES